MRPQELGIGELFGRIREAVIVADARTQRIVLWNPAATNIFGYSLSEALDLRVEALVPWHLKARHRMGIARYAQTGHGAYIDSQRLLDLPALRKGGEEISIELSLNPVGPVGDADGGGRRHSEQLREGGHHEFPVDRREGTFLGTGQVDHRVLLGSGGIPPKP